MSMRLSIIFVCFLAFGFTISSSTAQEFGHGANISKHTIGYTLGYVYPKIASGGKYSRVISGFNYGISGAFEWGKYYDSQISFMISPTFYFSSFRNEKKRYELYHAIEGKLIHRDEWIANYKEFGIIIPLSYEFPLFKSFRFGGGANISFPLSGYGSTNHVKYKYYLRLPGGGGVFLNLPIEQESNHDIDFRFYPRLGLNAKLLYKIPSQESVESYFCLEYMYDVTFSDVLYAHGTRFTLSYVHRFIKLKDVREKWDRVMMRNYRNN